MLALELLLVQILLGLVSALVLVGVPGLVVSVWLALVLLLLVCAQLAVLVLVLVLLVLVFVPGVYGLGPYGVLCAPWCR